MLKEPRRVFSELVPEQGTKRSLGVLLTSSLLYCITSILISRSETPVFHAAVLFVNASITDISYSNRPFSILPEVIFDGSVTST